MVAAPSPAPAAAQDLLAVANRLRAERRWREAADGYARVVTIAPRSDAAYVALIARAGLLLDRLGQPREALELFDRALAARPRGPLTEETQYGIAGCYRALGNVAAERAALHAFQASYPQSPLHRLVVSRLVALRP